MPRSHSLRIHLTGFLFSILTACLVFTTTAQGPAPNRVDSIHAEELREKITFLASEQFKGRGNGTNELNLAAEYIADTFASNGSKPRPDGHAGGGFQRGSAGAFNGNGHYWRAGLPEHPRACGIRRDRAARHFRTPQASISRHRHDYRRCRAQDSPDAERTWANT